MNKSRSSRSNFKNIFPNTRKTLLVSGKILQFLSPYLTTKIALKLFKTPFKFKTSTREKMMGKSAQKELVTVPNIEKEILVYSYGYSKRKVLLLHGWSGRGTQLYNIADKLLENGFMTISFDGPAHGKSTGKTTIMTEFITTVKLIDEKFGPFEIAIGHSLGGMTILNNIQQGLKVNKAVLIGSGDKISDIIVKFVKNIGLKPIIARRMKKYLNKKLKIEVDNYAASEASKSVKIKTLVIHDYQDKEVPVSCAYAIRQNLEQGEILVTNGLGHTRILNNPGVINRIITFINRKS